MGAAPTVVSQDSLSAMTISRPRRQRQLSLVGDDPAPIVKWVGGKTRLLPALLSLMPSDHADPIRTYFEPFAGGAALFFRVLPTRSVLGDTNRELIELYAEVVRDPAGLHAQVSALVDAHRADPVGTFYRIREQWNKGRKRLRPQVRASYMLYMNRACFNGLWRVNQSGEMNSSIGKPAKAGDPFPVCPSMARILAAQGALQGARLCCADYVDVIATACRGDLVYIDPPYLPASKTGNFTSYTKLGFGPTDHDQLAVHARDLVDRGVRVMVSSSDVPGVRERYVGFAVTEVSVGRTISCEIGDRGRVGELILTGGYEPRPPAPAPDGMSRRSRKSRKLDQVAGS